MKKWIKFAQEFAISMGLENLVLMAAEGGNRFFYTFVYIINF